MKKIGLIVFSFMVLAACNRNDDDATKMGSTGTEFYQIYSGSTFIYQVDSIAYDDNGPQQAIDTFYYQYKEEVGTGYNDAVGNLAFPVYRYFRQHDSEEWKVANTYVTSLKDNSAQRIEENTRYVKMIFPLKDRLTWDGNIFNNLGPQAYKVAGYGFPYQLNGSVVRATKVQHWEIDNFIEEIKRYEIYAENIGMVELLFDSLNTQNTGTKGFRYRLKLISHTR